MVKSNKLFKVLAIMLVAICLITACSGIVNALDTTGNWPTTVSGASSEFSGQAATWGNTILGFFQVVGYMAAVIVLVWLGVKYIMASPEGKAEIKKQAFAYILGAVLLFAASGIVTIVKNSITNGA